MNRFIVLCAVFLLGVFSVVAIAQTLTPIKGQSPELVQQDISACQAQAGTSSSTTPQSGGRVRGAAGGAVAGATVAQVRGNRHEEVYDRVDSDVKQQYRQNQAKDAAVAGAVVGGARQRQDRRQTRRDSGAAGDAYSNCMVQRGYQLSP